MARCLSIHHLEPRAPPLIAEPAWQGNRQRWPLVPLGAPPQDRGARPLVAQRTTMTQLWWPWPAPRSSDCATCSTTREGDTTAATGLRGIGILSRAPQLRARFINIIINPSSASPTRRYSWATPNGADRPPHRRVPDLFFTIVRNERTQRRCLAASAAVLSPKAFGGLEPSCPPTTPG